MNPVLLCGALLGLLAVIAGATAEHLLVPGLDSEAARRLEVALQFHRFGALAATAIGLALLAVGCPATRRHLAWSGGLLAAGTALFSFTIYLGLGTGSAFIGRLTPIGGLLKIAGWGWLAVAAWRGSPRPWETR